MKTLNKKALNVGPVHWRKVVGENASISNIPICAYSTPDADTAFPLPNKNIQKDNMRYRPKFLQNYSQHIHTNFLTPIPEESISAMTSAGANVSEPTNGDGYSIAYLGSDTWAVLNFDDPEEYLLETYQYNGTALVKIGNSLAVEILDEPRVYMCELSSTSVAIVETAEDDGKVYNWDGTDWTLGNNDTFPVTGISGLCKLTENVVCAINSGTLYAVQYDGSTWAQLSGTIAVPAATITNRIATLGENEVVVFDAGQNKLFLYSRGASAFTLEHTTSSIMVTNAFSVGLARLGENQIALFDGISNYIEFYENTGSAFSEIATQYGPLAFVPSNLCGGDGYLIGYTTTTIYTWNVPINLKLGVVRQGVLLNEFTLTQYEPSTDLFRYSAEINANIVGPGCYFVLFNAYNNQVFYQSNEIEFIADISDYVKIQYANSTNRDGYDFGSFSNVNLITFFDFDVVEQEWELEVKGADEESTGDFRIQKSKNKFYVALESQLFDHDMHNAMGSIFAMDSIQLNNQDVTVKDAYKRTQSKDSPLTNGRVSVYIDDLTDINYAE